MSARHARPPILRDIPPSGHVVLEASAGTGKTWTLERLVADLLLRTEPPLPLEQILVVTFTEKATAELRARLRAYLEKLLARRAGDGEDATGDPDPWILDEAARDRLTAAIEAYDAATISTIHGFCQRVLREHAFGAGRLPDQEVRDGRSLFAAAFREVLREALAEGDPQREGMLALLDREGSADAVEKLLWEVHVAGDDLGPVGDPVRVRQAARRLAALPGDLPARLRAAIRDRWNANTDATVEKNLLTPVREALAADDVDAVVATLIRWGRGTISSNVGKDGRDRLEKVLDVAGAADDAALRELAAALAELAAHALPSAFLPVIALAGRVEDRVHRHKQLGGLLDYDDMLTQLAAALDQRPELVASVRRRFRVALVDEFQDTDPVQWEIFRRLFWEPGAEGHRLVVVGDPKQAIYAFRGADVFTYLDVRRDVAESGGKPVPLDVCWRSTPQVVAALNALFAGAGDDGHFVATGIDYRPASCGRDKAAFRAGDPGEALQLMVVPEGSVHSSRTALARFVAEEVARLIGGGAEIDDEVAGEPTTGRLTYADVMVLVGSHGEAAIVQEALRSRGLPAVRIADRGVFATPEADHLLRILRAAAAPDDRQARLQALLTPFLGVAFEELGAARDLGDDHPFARRLHRWHELAAARRYGELFRDALHATGLARRLAFLAGGTRELVNYHHAIDRLLVEAAASPAEPAELVRRAEALRRRHEHAGKLLPPDEKERPADPEAVRILTIHAGKGLEAEVVFLAGGFGSGPPGKVHRYHQVGPDRRHRQRFHLGDPVGVVAGLVRREEEGEAEREIYVAATRARSRLYLPWLRRRGAGGAYAALERTLERLQRAGMPETFALRDVPLVDAGERAALEAAAGLADWAPPPPVAEAPPADLAGLRRARRGPLLTSYTRLHRQEEVAAEGAGAAGLVPAEEAAPAVDADDLPGGRAIGILLHAVLEEADPAVALAAADAAGWAEEEGVQHLLRRQARLHGLADEHLDRVRDLAWAGLRTPIALPGLDLPRGLAEPARRRREMEFLFPLPESGHPTLDAPADPDEPRPFRARDGFVQGVVDLLFEHDGRFWVLDWKSDRLADPSPAGIARRVEERYGLQVRLYSLAAARMLRLASAADAAARFGGVLYVFLRALAPGGRGLHHVPVGWAELQEWERELRGRAAS